MLTYRNMNEINYIALVTAEELNDSNEIFTRLYSNDVEVNYTINEDNKSIHILYIEAKEKGKGCGTETLKNFIDEFFDYDIEIEAVYQLCEWYKKFGFKFLYGIDDMMCCKMNLKKRGG